MATMKSTIKAGLNGLNKSKVGLDLSTIVKLDCDWNLLYSGKGVGKSYAIRSRALDKFLQYGDELCLVRRRDIDTKPANIRKYFEKVDVETLTKGKYNCIDVKSNEIFFCTIDDNFKLHRGVRLGHIISLAQFERFKGADYPKVSTIINEEFISESGDYIVDESTTFMKLINTVFRPLTKGEFETLNKEEQERYYRREVWLVGNTISRLCPYFRDYNLQNILKQSPNTIDIYTYTYPNEIDDMTGKPKVVTLGCWYIGENEQGNKKSHGFVFGKGYDTIVKGEWQTDIYPKLQHPYEEYTKIYELLLCVETRYCIQLLKYKDEYTLYIYPFTSLRENIKRRITADYSTSPYITNQLLGYIAVEGFIIDMIRLNKIAYSDNLTGTEFANYKRQIVNGLLEK